MFTAYRPAWSGSHSPDTIPGMALAPGFRLRSKSTNALELAGSWLSARLGTIGVLSESPRDHEAF
jgi:hypothetical protein